MKKTTSVSDRWREKKPKSQWFFYLQWLNTCSIYTSMNELVFASHPPSMHDSRINLHQWTFFSFSLVESINRHTLYLTLYSSKCSLLCNVILCVINVCLFSFRPRGWVEIIDRGTEGPKLSRVKGKGEKGKGKKEQGQEAARQSPVYLGPGEWCIHS